KARMPSPSNSTPKPCNIELNPRGRTRPRGCFFRADRTAAQRQDPSHAMPAISAVLIVKNEARRLPACLEALRQVVDEIVVADTGSTDDTLAVARDYTPHCHEIP